MLVVFIVLKCSRKKKTVKGGGVVGKKENMKQRERERIGGDGKRHKNRNTETRKGRLGHGDSSLVTLGCTEWPCEGWTNDIGGMTWDSG